MKRILITGKDSYVGTSVKKYLEQRPKKYKVDELDVKGDEWEKYDFSKYNVVFHVAGIAHVDVKKADEETKKLYYKVNCDLAEEVAKVAKKAGVKQFIFMSSAIVYGDSAPIGKKKVITIDTEPAPANFYGDSKLQAEIKLNKLVNKSFIVSLVRPPMIYGEGRKGNYPTLRKLALRLPVFPKVKNERSMIYIDNFTAFIKEIIDNDRSGILMPSNPDAISTSEIVKTIAEANNKKIAIVPGFTWALKLLSHLTPFVNKAFGSMSYKIRKGDYQKYTTLESIRKMEEAQ
ncbi:MAG: NAD-dependent epimerase/dehydratase family protein [Candidatus Saccharibacteria bacterium]|nr:NAD-dependent epimerase/dehydratase family protein [Candidatus Saccharibacteria bacterium]